jgi:hypothetical protein
MHRRDLLKLSTLALAGTCLPSLDLLAGAFPKDSRADIDIYFHELIDGFLRNAKKTSDSFAVCNYPGGTVLKSCIAKSGKTYVSVARMLPALAAWVAADRQPMTTVVDGETFDLRKVLQQAYVNAFDPAHPDYWQPARTDKPSQHQVEAALVAWSLWQLGDKFLETLTSKQRSNIQAWLASCTRIPERDNNHAWFSAINQATRIQLSRRWKEFSGDEAWMLADVKAMDALASSAGTDGWYSDSTVESVYDYYNFWTYASHYLYWNRIIGSEYPELSAPFSKRLKLFLQSAPNFFAADGGHVLFGRSLVYRWSVLMPLVESYAQGMWPHSPGLLRGIVRRNLEYHWKLGAFDKEHGKLRENFAPEGSLDVREMYVDNGHPYWCMQAFSLYLIPERDAFWTAKEEPLPIDRADYRIPFKGARMLLVGTKRSGQVRWLQSRNEPRKKVRYRDQYIKFAYSSHFPFNLINRADRCPWDQTLVFRNRKNLNCVGRGGIIRGELMNDGTQTEWWAQAGDYKFQVITRIRISDEFEHHTHIVTVPAGAEGGEIEVVEGSYALGLAKGEEARHEKLGAWQFIGSSRSGHLIGSCNLEGYDSMDVSSSFDQDTAYSVNAVYPAVAVNTLRANLKSSHLRLTSLHYASPRPLAKQEIIKRAGEIVASIKNTASDPDWSGAAARP